MNKIKVLLLGSGGREHAFAWSMSKSPQLEKLFIAPGNPGTAECGTNVEIDILDNLAVAEFCISHEIDLVLVGPEAPLVNGLHDHLSENSNTQGITIIGPKKEGAMLEGSKDFSKQFMLRNGVPTAQYKTFDQATLEDGYTFLASLKAPFVLKCDGLAAGKGVLILPSLAEAKEALKGILLDESFGEAGAKVVIEEFLDGIELSAFILTDGRDYLLLPTAKDYKRIGEGDTGLNTGGMGALSPAPVADDTFMARVKEEVIDRTLAGLQKDGIAYEGFIFIGLMRVGDAPYVIEYNVRMGDPETEAVLPLVESDLLSHFIALGKGRLSDEHIQISEKCATTVMMVSGGYPETYEKGKIIEGMYDVNEHSIVFQAGTKMNGDNLVTNGGRVLTVTSIHDDMNEALAHSFNNLKKVSFEGSYFRSDIGYELKGKVTIK